MKHRLWQTRVLRLTLVSLSSETCVILRRLETAAGELLCEYTEDVMRPGDSLVIRWGDTETIA